MLEIFVWLFVPVLFGSIAVYATIRYFVWPYLCDFGNWLGRP